MSTVSPTVPLIFSSEKNKRDGLITVCSIEVTLHATMRRATRGHGLHPFLLLLALVATHGGIEDYFFSLRGIDTLQPGRTALLFSLATVCDSSISTTMPHLCSRCVSTLQLDPKLSISSTALLSISLQAPRSKLSHQVPNLPTPLHKQYVVHCFCSVQCVTI